MTDLEQQLSAQLSQAEGTIEKLETRLRGAEHDALEKTKLLVQLPTPEQVAELEGTIRQLQEENARFKEMWADEIQPSHAWAQSYLDAGRWAGHERLDAIKTEPLERDAELTTLRAQGAALAQERDQFALTLNRFGSAITVCWNKLYYNGHKELAGQLDDERSKALGLLTNREFAARLAGQQPEAEASQAALVALVQQRVREDAPTATSEYCWHCQADVNGKNGPKQDHTDECWWKRAAIALADALRAPRAPEEP